MDIDILFKPQVEATEQMAQNCIDISQYKNQRKRIVHVQVTCTITVCSSFLLFQFYFTND